MTTHFDDLNAVLFAAKDGRVACDAINELSKHARNGSEQAKELLAHYVTEGPIHHMKVHACSCLAESVTEPHSGFAALFRKGLSDPELRYWSILGYVNSVRKAAYEELKRMAEDTSIRLPEHAHAVKCLARFSKQLFDRNLPADPGSWRETDLRLSELRAWAEGGYRDGAGYSPPSRHAALDDPKTAFEKILSRLDKKLSTERQERQDLADPSDWLAVASLDDIQRVKARWALPSAYLDFLTRFSPIKVTIESQEFYNHFQLFGAGEQIEAQEGYSFNPVQQQPIEDWPAHLVVIANHGGDPYVLELSQSDGQDAPVETAEHGTGEWEFYRVADSFSAFLEILAK